MVAEAFSIRLQSSASADGGPKAGEVVDHLEDIVIFLMQGTLQASWSILFVFFRMTVSPMSVHAEAKRSMRLRRASFRPTDQALYFCDKVNSIQYGERFAIHCFLCISVFVFKIWVSKILMSHTFAMFYNVNVSKTKISPFYTVLCPIWQSSLPSLTELSSLFDRFNSPIFSVLSPLFYIVISPIWQICRSYFLTEFSPLFNRVLSPIWQSALPYFIQSFLSYLTDLQR